MILLEKAIFNKPTNLLGDLQNVRSSNYWWNIADFQIFRKLREETKIAQAINKLPISNDWKTNLKDHFVFQQMLFEVTAEALFGEKPDDDNSLISKQVEAHIKIFEIEEILKSIDD